MEWHLVGSKSVGVDVGAPPVPPPTPPVTPAQQVPFWVWIILALLGLGLLSKR